jgi:hypothetical protein
MSKVTTHPSEADHNGNYPVKIDGVVVGWGAVRRARHSHHSSFQFYPLGGSGKSVPYDFKRDAWCFDGVGDLKTRLPNVLTEQKIETE